MNAPLPEAVRRALEAEVNFDERVEIGMSKVPSGAS